MFLADIERTVVVRSFLSMLSYRGIAGGLQKQASISNDASLATISNALRIFAIELPQRELAILRRNLPPELRQLLVRARTSYVDKRHRNHEGRPIVELLAAALEVSIAEAKRRVLILLVEMRAGISPWDDVEFLEAIDRIIAQIDSVPAQVVVA